MSLAMIDHDGAARFCAYTDPAIKLFGRDIALISSGSHEASREPSIVSQMQEYSHQDTQPETPHTKECNEPMDIVSNEPRDLTCRIDDGGEAMSSISIKKPACGTNILIGSPSHCADTNLPKGEEPQGLSTYDKMPKKPDKLIPCPRCRSLDTKFCYFNNYNVNQPRHFCRKCQRYWTAGGMLRNVPVGAGRRKHKHSTLHQKHVVVSDAMSVRSSPTDTAHHRCSGSISTAGAVLSNPSKSKLHVLPLETHAISALDSPSTSSTMLSFGQESPLCQSMAATTLSMQDCAAVQKHGRLNVNATGAADVEFTAGSKDLAEHEASIRNSMNNSTSGYHDVPAVPLNCSTSRSPANSLIAAGLSLQESELKVNAGSEVHEMQAKESGFSKYRGAWHLGSNIVSNSPFNPATAYALDSKIGSNAALSLPPPNILACNGAPGSFWPGFPWPLMNPAMWGTLPLEWAGPWSLPLCPPPAAAAALVPFSGAGSLSQKKSECSQPEKCLWVPKTLRIDDPLDAARSSIWTTLGLGDGPLPSPVNGAAKAFQVKSECKDTNESIDTKRHSNPAAFSRSAAFHEKG
eukprot:c17607_g1_i1 orf=702-2429(+)